MKALINKIIPCSFVDGPGSRMVVFLQGCNMNCEYCHNPETQNICSNSGECVGICKEMTIGDVLNIVIKNQDFIDGITFSGGECTLWGDFLVKLIKKIKGNTNLNCFLDTNGLIETQLLENLTEIADGFLVDLKVFNEENHIKLTGKSNKIVLENIKTISSKKVLYEVRTCIVPGYNDSEEEIINISEFIKNLNTYTKLQLTPFRTMGVKGRLKLFGNMESERFIELYNVSRKTLGNRVARTI